MAIFLLLLGVVFWKLNDYYKYEKIGRLRQQLNQQTVSLKTSVTSQLGQLKNTLSSYTGQISESQINWIQLSPFYGLAKLSIGQNGAFNVKNLFTRSGSPADNWDQVFLQKALSFGRFQKLSTQVQLFQSKSGEKFMVLIFADAVEGTDLTALVGDAHYFQKYFDVTRNANSTQALLTSDATVVSHTQSEYVASKTNETKLNPEKYLIEKDNIRSTNLSLLTYASVRTVSGWNVPYFVTVFILGLSLVCAGVLLYFMGSFDRNVASERLKQRELEKDQIYQNVLKETQEQDVISTTEFVSQSEETKFNLKPIEPLNEIESVITVQSQEDVAIEKPTFELTEVSQADLLGIPSMKSLNTILEDVIRDLKSILDNQGIKIHKECYSERLYHLDENRVKKAFNNILTNSIEAKALHIEIKIKDVAGHDLVEIIDDGMGINGRDLAAVVQPYFTTKDKSQHRGLGLSEVISVFERYNGSIKINNNTNGKGVAVKITMNPSQNEYLELSDSSVISEDEIIDLDQILELDSMSDDLSVPKAEALIDQTSLELENEQTLMQYKADDQIKIDENPQIQFSSVNKPMDQFLVNIRSPKVNKVETST